MQSIACKWHLMNRWMANLPPDGMFILTEKLTNIPRQLRNHVWPQWDSKIKPLRKLFTKIKTLYLFPWRQNTNTYLFSFFQFCEILVDFSLPVVLHRAEWFVFGRDEIWVLDFLQCLDNLGKRWTFVGVLTPANCNKLKKLRPGRTRIRIEKGSLHESSVNSPIFNDWSESDSHQLSSKFEPF